MQTRHLWMSDMPQKAASGKKTGELLATIHAQTDCLLMHL